MRTVALAIFAAVASATTVDPNAAQQTECNAYLWGIQQKGWTCVADTNDAKVSTCTNTNTSLNATSNTVDSTSDPW